MAKYDCFGDRVIVTAFSRLLLQLEVELEPLTEFGLVYENLTAGFPDFYSSTLVMSRELTLHTCPAPLPRS